ncbi:hypothetical protein OC845_006196 [Tilletia horrida]|nr:hypothetical protein OC845_006196 [Tilletia horrida]
MVKSILLFGATGYLGGNTLHRLLTSDYGDRSRPHIVALVSSQSAAEKIAAWARQLDSKLDVHIVDSPTESKEDLKGVRTHSLDLVPVPRDPAHVWYATAEHYASHTDCAVQLATSDDLKLTQAIDRGLAQAKTRERRGTIVHASGTQLIESAPLGKDVDTPTYDDTDLDQLNRIPDSAAHRMIDLEITTDIAMGKIGGGAIVCPTLIWGIANGPMRTISQQVPGMVEKALSPLNKRAVYAGEGTNVWNSIHVDDLTTLIYHLIQRWTFQPLPTSPPEPHSTFYFAARKELFAFKDLAAAIGIALNKFNDPATSQPLIPTPEPVSVTVPKYDDTQKGVRVEDDSRAAQANEDEKRAPTWPCRTCARCVCRRGKQEFGWEPQREFDHDAMVDEVTSYLKIWTHDGTLQSKIQG